MAGFTPGQLYWWDVPRVLSPEEERAIDERLAAAELAGTHEEEAAKAKNKKSDIRPALVLRVNGTNVVLAMCTRTDYRASGAVKVEPDDVTPAGAIEVTTFVRQDKIWTDHERWNEGYMGRLKPDKFEECKKAVSDYILGDS